MKVTFESKGDFDKVLTWLSEVSNATPTKALNTIAKNGEKFLAANTPKDTGATASGWYSEITTEPGFSEIVWKNRAHPEAQVSVAKIIETGHGTRNGGYVNPQPYINNAMDPIWKTAGDLVAKELKL